MSDIILGIGASHSTLMNTHWDEVVDKEAAHRFRDGLFVARDMLREEKPDAIVVIGSNHFRGFFLDLMPPFTIGVAECVGSGEAGTPEGALPVDTELARHLTWSLTRNHFDAAFSLRMQVDHGITHGLQYLTPEIDVPIVPIVVNMFAPPLPTLQRCYQLGRAIRAGIESDPSGKRVAVIASGGLSHRLPWPKWYETFSDDDRYLVEAWVEGRESWRDYEVRRRQIVLAATPDINDQFDREFLDLLESGSIQSLLKYSDEDLERLAGNGGNEIRSWLIMAAAVGGPGRTLAYEPMPEWLTGMAVAAVQNKRVSADQASGKREKN